MHVPVSRSIASIATTTYNFDFTIFSFALHHGKVRMLEFIEFNNGVNPELNPSTIHIFVNRENLGFEDCDDVDPTQTLDLTADHSMKQPIPLKFVKYQRVKSLTLFISDNQGGDITALGGIKIFGFPVDTVNMNDFKKQQQEM
jgi:PITH domain